MRSSNGETLVAITHVPSPNMQRGERTFVEELEVHYELAYALAQVPGRVPEAIAECRKMLLLKPGDGPGQQLLASLLAFQPGTRR